MLKLLATLFLLVATFSRSVAQSQDFDINSSYEFKYPVNMPLLSGAALKNQPSIRVDDVWLIAKGELVKLIAKKGEFYLATYKGQSGYIHFVFVDGDYTTFSSRNYLRGESSVAKPAELVNTSGVNDGEWYGFVDVPTTIREFVSVTSYPLIDVDRGAIVRVLGKGSDHWKVEYNGKIGYVGQYYIGDTSKGNKPFKKVAYTGPTSQSPPASAVSNYYAPDGTTRSDAPSTMYSTPTTGATIHTGPRGGRYYYNSNGNKTYIRRK